MSRKLSASNQRVPEKKWLNEQESKTEGTSDTRETTNENEEDVENE